MGKIAIPKEIRWTLRIRRSILLQTALTPWETYCFLCWICPNGGGGRGGHRDDERGRTVGIRAAPHNSARDSSERFCSKIKFGKRRNTVCLSSFSNCNIGAKDPLMSADAIVRCCLRVIPRIPNIPQNHAHPGHKAGWAWCCAGGAASSCNCNSRILTPAAANPLYRKSQFLHRYVGDAWFGQESFWGKHLESETGESILCQMFPAQKCCR